MDVDEAALPAEIMGRFPAGAIREVRVRRIGDLGANARDAVETRNAGERGQADGGTGECEVWLVPAAAGPGRPRRDWLAEFRRQHRGVLERLMRDLPNLTGGRCRRLRIADRRRVIVLETPGGAAGGGELARDGDGDGGMEWEQTAVMTRLGPVDLDTLDTLVAAGYAASRAEAVRWALARIRERPAYEEVRRRVTELERLKAEI